MAVYGTILCLGDSLTHGARDEFGRCYPMELSDLLYDLFGQTWICAEEGVNGETSSDILRRSLSVIKRYPEAFEMVLCCGMNDSKDTVATPVDVYRRNVEQIIRIAQVYGKDVILCTVPDLNGFGVPDYTKNSQKRIDEFNKVIESIAKEQNLRLVDLRGMGKECYADGVHFSNLGNKEVAARVAKVIIEKRGFQLPEWDVLRKRALTENPNRRISDKITAQEGA